MSDIQTTPYGDWARYYGSLAVRVFPITPRKKTPPLLKDWPSNATTDNTIISRWWNNHPDANIGVAMGAASQLVDVETDTKNGTIGEHELAKWAFSSGVVLPETWSFKSGNGGIHRLYRYAGSLGNRASMLPCVDVRADGGYAVFPPSLHPNGNCYEWLPEHSPADMPDGPAALPLELALLIADGARKPRLEVPEMIPDGSRNDTLFRLACSLRERGLMEGEILASITAVNLIRCAVPLDSSEVETICQQAAQYPAGKLPLAERQSVMPEDFTDTGNAVVFARVFHGKAAYCVSTDWLVWDGARWEESELAAQVLAMRLTDTMQAEVVAMVGTARAALTDAEAASDDLRAKEANHKVKRAQEYLKHARATRNKPKIQALLTLARSLLEVKAAALDADPYALNTPAGMVDLRTGNILPHNPAKFCTKITTVGPSGVGADRWTALIGTVTEQDAELATYIQLTAGMAAVGKVFEENLIIALGDGSNGKSTIFNPMAAVLGDYSGTLDADLFTTAKQNKGAELATLRGKRLVIAAELEEGRRLSTGALKRIASTDKIHAERKYLAPEDFWPTHTAVLYTNHAPRVGSTDTGTWRRLAVIPFTAKIPKKGEVKNYAAVLVREAGGAILSWIIQGAVTFCKAGHTLPHCARVEEAKEQYRQKNDWMSHFLEECCIVHPLQTSAGSVLYAVYRGWAQNNEPYVRSNGDFTAELEKRGFEMRKTSRANSWIGLAVRPFEPTVISNTGA